MQPAHQEATRSTFYEELFAINLPYTEPERIRQEVELVWRHVESHEHFVGLTKRLITEHMMELNIYTITQFFRKAFSVYPESDFVKASLGLWLWLHGPDDDEEAAVLMSEVQDEELRHAPWT